jgi:hypothetical protein
VRFFQHHRHRLLEILVCGLFLAIAGWQMAGPEPIGLPDNGDFPKVLAALNIGHEPQEIKQVGNDRYFAPSFLIDRRFHWEAGLPSSEFWVAKAAKRLALWFLPSGHFDLRLMGVVHAAILVLALWLLLRAYRTERFGLAVLAGLLLLFIFTDVEYVQFFSTAYADAASIVFFCLLVAISVNLCRAGSRMSLGWALGFTAAGFLFLTSKLQHQLAVIPLCALAGIFAWRASAKWVRRSLVAAAVVFLAATVWMAKHTRADYRADPIYNLLFLRLGPYSQPPTNVLREFGMPLQYSRYMGKLPFQQGYLLDDMTERRFFVNQVTLGAIVGYYLRHPGVAAHFLANDLQEFAPDTDLSGWPGMYRFRLADYQQHRTNTRFTWWSSIRRFTQGQFPWFIPLLYLLTLIICFLAATRKEFATAFEAWPVLGFLVLVGAITFSVVALNDCLESARHIIIFQTATDLSIFLLLMGAAKFAFFRSEAKMKRINHPGASLEGTLRPVASRQL